MTGNINVSELATMDTSGASPVVSTDAAQIPLTMIRSEDIAALTHEAPPSGIEKARVGQSLTRPGGQGTISTDNNSPRSKATASIDLLPKASLPIYSLPGLFLLQPVDANTASHSKLLPGQIGNSNKKTHSTLIDKTADTQRDGVPLEDAGTTTGLFRVASRENTIELGYEQASILPTDDIKSPKTKSLKKTLPEASKGLCLGTNVASMRPEREKFGAIQLPSQLVATGGTHIEHTKDDRSLQNRMWPRVRPLMVSPSNLAKRPLSAIENATESISSTEPETLNQGNQPKRPKADLDLLLKPGQDAALDRFQLPGSAPRLSLLGTPSLSAPIFGTAPKSVEATSRLGNSMENLVSNGAMKSTERKSRSKDTGISQNTQMGSLPVYIKNEFQDSRGVDNAEPPKTGCGVDILKLFENIHMTANAWNKLQETQTKMDRYVTSPRTSEQFNIEGVLSNSIPLSKKRRNALINAQAQLEYRRSQYLLGEMGSKPQNEVENRYGIVHSGPHDTAPTTQNSMAPQANAARAALPLSELQNVAQSNPPSQPRMILTLPRLDINQTPEALQVAKNILEEGNSLLASFSNVQLAFSAQDAKHG